MKTLFCGPWVGEFGWEIIWQGMCRKKAKDFDRVVVSSFESSRALYSDFSSEYISHTFRTGHSDGPRMDGLSYEEMSNFARQHSSEIFVPSMSMVNSMMKAKSSGCGLYVVPISTKPDVAPDIIIHARCRTDHGKYRNWSKEKWNNLCSHLTSEGFSVGSIGTSAFCPDKTDDLRNISLYRTINYIVASKLVVGPSSGPMVLACLCNKPIVVWIEKKDDVKDRYLKEWNFHNSKVDLIDNRDPTATQVIHTLTRLGIDK